jgi:hypothetical protein
MNVGINFIHFAWTKVSERNLRVTIMLKEAIFPSNTPNSGNIKWNFADTFAEVGYILWNLAKNGIFQHSMEFNEILHY